jgi:hypothetical protein
MMCIRAPRLIVKCQLMHHAAKRCQFLKSAPPCHVSDIVNKTGQDCVHASLEHANVLMAGLSPAASQTRRTVAVRDTRRPCLEAGRIVTAGKVTKVTKKGTQMY